MNNALHSNRSETVLGLGELRGLTEDEARARLERDGLNELPSEKKRGILAIVLEVVREPMFLMLVAAGSLYLFMGEATDALMLLGFVFVVMGITVVQERRTEHALDALRDLSSPRALVLRDGVQRRIPGVEVACGDLIFLSEGDRVPADALLRRAIHLSVDESLLTGESVPVRKAPSDEAQALDRPGGDDLSSVYSGTLVTAGQGVAEVAATGARTELGKIGKALQQMQPEATLLQKETLVVVLYALTRGGSIAVWKEGFLAGIGMAMATLPEEFPVVLTVFLALGAWRISRSRVLTRRMPAIETLGAATVLCVDKTGTLTLNQMTLKELRLAGQSVEVGEGTTNLSEAFRTLLENAVNACKREAFDPMERALHAAGARSLGDGVLRPGWTIEREYPLTSKLLAMTNVWRNGESDRVVIASKGAPEAISELCRLSPERRESMMRDVAALASKGLRVLGVARAEMAIRDVPDEHTALELSYVGLVALEDPLRPTVPAAVAECQSAGIRVVMITGDYSATALSIARQAGLADHEAVICGPELEAMTDEELAGRIGKVQVFARVVPEQKLRIVEAFKANGEIVAMTGDGVNDAPALKSAHIGIAMGGRGTDVAREAASLVLLDDDFSSIVAAIRLGRNIFDNIKKAVSFILAVHVPIAGLSMIPVFFRDWPLLLLPVHIVFLELVIDPSCTLIFEAEESEPGIMSRPPRNPNERLFSTATLGLAVLQGLTVLGVCLGVFLFARHSHSPEAARALTFTSLVVAFLFIILTNRSWNRSILQMLRMRNKALWWVVSGAVAFLALVLWVPVARGLFHFAPLHWPDLILSVGAGVAWVVAFEFVKLTRRRRAARAPA
jgi:Ca2+-transporting ATPase